MVLLQPTVRKAARFTQRRLRQLAVTERVAGHVMRLGAIGMLEPPCCSNAGTKGGAMWKLCAGAIIFPYARLCRSVHAHIQLRAVLALTEMAVRHHRMPIEVLDRLRNAALEAGFHANIPTASSAGRMNGTSHMNGMSSTSTGALTDASTGAAFDFRTRIPPTSFPA